ncbi:hypothetical protein X975_16969, partial [Stegodyphus mimosarum]
MYRCFGKPQNSNEFLRHFVNKTKSLAHEGLLFREQIIKINIHALICDAPAKSYVLQVKGHTGYSSYTKCTIEGKYKERRICFPGEANELRSDEFKNLIYDDYHIGETSLTELPNFDLVTSVALDYMHLICLGIMRKLLNLWLSSPLTVKLGA